MGKHSDPFCDAQLNKKWTRNWEGETVSLCLTINLFFSLGTMVCVNCINVNVSAGMQTCLAALRQFALLLISVFGIIHLATGTHFAANHFELIPPWS